MLKPTPTTRFKKDLKRYKYQKNNIKGLNEIIGLLVQEKPLEKKHLDHPLSGNWKNSRERHVAPDLLLIYRIDEEQEKLFLERFGSHSEFFN